MSDLTAAEVIAAAVDRLTPETWRKSGWGPHGVTTNVRAGTECLLDALGDAAASTCERLAFVEAKVALRKVITEQYPDRLADRPIVSVIPSFNDHRDTTLDDLHVVRDKAIAELGGLP